MNMMEDGARANRFERYTDDELAATVEQVSHLPLTPFEQSVVDDIKAEQARRAACLQKTERSDNG